MRIALAGARDTRGRQLRSGEAARRAAGGFTMIEVLISMLLLAIMLLGLAALQIGTIRNVMDSKRHAEATRLAESVLERYQTMPLDELPTGFWDIPPKRDGGDMQNVAVNGEDPGPYTVQVLGEIVGSSGRERLLTVRVSWLLASAGAAATGGASYRTNSVLMSIRRSQ